MQINLNSGGETRLAKLLSLTIISLKNSIGLIFRLERSKLKRADLDNREVFWIRIEILAAYFSLET